jgi:AcrR family transcriptional regulator
MNVTAKSAASSYPSRTRRRLQTRDRVFEAALAEFRRTGVGAAQIEDIVKTAGVARGTFYLHFPTKDHVLMELMRRKQNDIAQRLGSVRSASAKAFLRRVVDLMLEDAGKEDPALWHELFAVIGRHATEMRTEASALVEKLIAFFLAAQERGDVRSDVTPFDLTSVFLPGVYGLLQMRLAAPEADLREALYRVVDVFVRGIAP